MKTAFMALGLAVLLAPAGIGQEFGTQARDAASSSSFQCQNGQSLSMRFGTRNGESVAAVTTEGERHVLALQPWDGVVPQVVWRDNSHTLTWDVGVQIMWMDGASHLSCGRGAHRH